MKTFDEAVSELRARAKAEITAHPEERHEIVHALMEDEADLEDAWLCNFEE